jgi:hypothetical protein
MSRIKELKENPENKVNLVNIMNVIIPDVKNNTKYVETLLRMFHNDIKIQQNALNERIQTFEVTPEKVNSLNKLEKIFLTILLNEKENRETFKAFIKFIEYNEKGMIENNDLQSYKSLSDMMTEYKKAEAKEQEKLYEKQVIKLLDDDNWFACIPLTYESSLKYGSSTTWCTASRDYPGHYTSYTKNGTLIYTWNKKTKKKFAIYCEVKESGRKRDKKITFWNEKDKQIEGFYCGFSLELYQIISDLFKLDNMNDNNVETIEDMRYKELGTKEPSLPKHNFFKKKEINLGSDPTPATPATSAVADDRGPITEPQDANADYADIYETIRNYMGGRR